MSMHSNLKNTPSFMDKDLLKTSQTFTTGSPQSEINFEEYIKNLDELVNSKVAQGFQMMISKIVVLIEEQVKCRVTEEVAEQLGQMIVNGKLINQSLLSQIKYKSKEKSKSQEKAKSQDGKSVNMAMLENDSSNSEMLQCVSVLDMEQSNSKIDRIDEETEDDGTNNSISQNGHSMHDHISLLHSRTTLIQEGSQNLPTGTTCNSVSNVEVSIEQPMKATIKPQNLQTIRKSKDNFNPIQNCQISMFSNNQIAASEKQLKTARSSRLKDNDRNVMTMTKHSNQQSKKTMIGGSKTTRFMTKKQISERNSPRMSPNQQGLETKKVVNISQNESTKSNSNNSKIVELSNAGQKLRNQINNRVIMGGKEIKVNDASRIKWQAVGSNLSSLRSSQQELHVGSTHEQERQTGPAAAASKNYMRNDQQLYFQNGADNAGGGAGSTVGGEAGNKAMNTPQLAVNNRFNISVKRIETQVSSRETSSMRGRDKTPPASGTISEKNNLISLKKFGTQPASRNSSRMSNRDRNYSPEVQRQNGHNPQILELQRQISSNRKQPIITFAKDRSRQGGLKSGGKNIRTSPSAQVSTNSKHSPKLKLLRRFN